MGDRECIKCGEYKPVTDFEKHKKGRDGLSPYCRPCVRKQAKIYYNNHKEKRLAKNRKYYYDNREKVIIGVKKRYYSFDGYMKTLFNNIQRRVRSSNYNNRTCEFTKEEFMSFMEKNIDQYSKLYNNWKDNEYKKKYAPSIDRINNDGNYTLDNMQVITHGENSKKGSKANYEKT